MAFVVFEGLDASGKSTLISLVEESLKKSDKDTVFLRDPGSTDLGERLRNIILATDIEPPVAKAETLMYQTARVQMVEKNIKPQLAKGSWVLCDRFYSSTVAFQAFGRGLDLEEVEGLNQFVAGDCPPDMFILLDITVEESTRRKENRAKESGVGQDRLEKEDRSFQEKVREGYLYQAKKNPERWLVLDGTKTPEELFELTIQEFKRHGWLQ